MNLTKLPAQFTIKSMATSGYMVGTYLNQMSVFGQAVFDEDTHASVKHICPCFYPLQSLSKAVKLMSIKLNKTFHIDTTIHNFDNTVLEIK